MYRLPLIPCSKDARLPVQLQRAMAAEAEAAREARAKVRLKNSIFVPSTNLNSDNKKPSNFTQSKNAK